MLPILAKRAKCITPRIRAGRFARYPRASGRGFAVPQIASDSTTIACDRTKNSALHLLHQLAYRQTQSKHNMSTFIKRIVVLVFVTTLLAIVGVGCNTAHGFGKDVENAGESIQDGTK